MNIIDAIFIPVFIIFLIISICHIYKQEKAKRRRNRIYREQREREDRKRRLIAEKPDYVIFLSTLMQSNEPIRYIGRFDSLDEIKPEQNDFANVGDLEYLYRDGKWYEIVDDRPYKFKGIQL